MKEENDFFLNKNIKFLRELNKESQEELAEIVNKKGTAIGNWERGERNPDYIDIYKLSKHFNVTIDDLVKKNLKLQNNVELDEKHKLDRIITEKSYQMSEEDKKMIINIMDSINARNDIKGSDEKE